MEICCAHHLLLGNQALEDTGHVVAMTRLQGTSAYINAVSSSELEDAQGEADAEGEGGAGGAGGVSATLLQKQVRDPWARVRESRSHGVRESWSQGVTESGRERRSQGVCVCARAPAFAMHLNPKFQTLTLIPKPYTLNSDARAERIGANPANPALTPTAQPGGHKAGGG